MRQWIAAFTIAAGALPVSAAAAQSLDGAYRGMFVCQKMAASPDILHVPVDIAIKDGNVQFARPILNWDGRRVVGSELGSGKVEADGKIHLTSQWHIRDVYLSRRLYRHADRYRWDAHRHAILERRGRQRRQPGLLGGAGVRPTAQRAARRE